jgi:hypothetical protein
MTPMSWVMITYIASDIQLFSAMRAKFTGEPGSGDGPTREIFGVIANEFFGPRSPFFAPSPGTLCIELIIIIEFIFSSI